MDWENKYRPRTFSDVRGQPHAVKQLAGLIRRGQRRRHLLLSGAVGSGKTSLMRLFAQGLNCVAPESDGSPCGSCEFCIDPARYFIEWDTAGRGGSKDDILRVVGQNALAVGRSKVRVVFFDECHALTVDAQDAILKSIEEAGPGLAFCFATTEPKPLRPALLSRLCDIRIRSLTPDDAYEYLKWIADQENARFDPAALHLIVAAKPPYARDLVIALQELAGLGRHIDAKLVKEYYDLSACDHLSQYCQALAVGDRTMQSRVMREWSDSVHEKRKWIESFICAVYYNNILGQEHIVDPMVHSLVEARQGFAEQLRGRLRVDLIRLKSVFERMMKFWSQHPQSSESAAYLTLGLFEALINDGLSAVHDLGRIDRSERRDVDAAVNDATGREPKAPETTSRSMYLERSDVRDIVNKASFFAQDTGKYLNTTARIEIARSVDLEARGEGELKSLFQMLDARVGSTFEQFAGLALLEREQGMLVARIVAYVDDESVAEFEQACATASSRPGMRVAEMQFGPTTNALAFHWNAVRELCAGLQPDNGADDADLRQLLGISKTMWRAPGPVACQRVYFSRCLTARSIAAACFPEMPSLSAFDANAWKWIAHGWEAKEFLDRRRELDLRRGQLETVRRRWQDDPVRYARERDEHLHAWRNIPPEARARRWRGWW